MSIPVHMIGHVSIVSPFLLVSQKPPETPQQFLEQGIQLSFLCSRTRSIDKGGAPGLALKLLQNGCHLFRWSPDYGHSFVKSGQT